MKNFIKVAIVLLIGSVAFAESEIPEYKKIYKLGVLESTVGTVKVEGSPIGDQYILTYLERDNFGFSEKETKILEICDRDTFVTD